MNAVNKNTVTEQEKIEQAINIITQDIDASQVPESIRATVETEEAVASALEQKVAEMIEEQQKFYNKVMAVHMSLLATDSMVNGNMVERIAGSALNTATVTDNKVAIVATLPVVALCHIKRKGFVKAGLDNVVSGVVSYGFVKGLDALTSDIDKKLK